MIRRRTLVAAALALPAAAHAQEIGSAQRPLRIGVTAGPHAQVMEKVREIAARDGLAIRIVEFQDYIQPNVALAAGDLDANSYQHQPFLDQQVRDRRLAIVGAGKTLIFPMGMYFAPPPPRGRIPNGGASPSERPDQWRPWRWCCWRGPAPSACARALDFRATVADRDGKP
jgi:D-methionine transport system substrate-binding protein